MAQLTVKALAKQYGVSARDVIWELNEQGIETDNSVDSIIPEDMRELVESYFSDLYDHEDIHIRANDKRSGKAQVKNSSKGSGQEQFQRERKKCSGEKSASGRFRK